MPEEDFHLSDHTHLQTHWGRLQSDEVDLTPLSSDHSRTLVLPSRAASREALNKHPLFCSFDRTRLGSWTGLPQPSIDVRLLDTAIDQFGRKGLEGASTRAIAAAAGTTMSSITYHYGGKQGLYLAAARHIADQMGERMAPALAASETQSREGEGPDAALTELLAIIDRFVGVMVHPESAAWARFIVREQMEPTEAFDVLYGGVMGRLVDRLSGLIVRISEGRCDAAEARLKTVAIVGQALVFRVARATLLRVTGWTDIDADGAEAIRRIVRAHTGAILRSTLGDLAP